MKKLSEGEMIFRFLQPQGLFLDVGCGEGRHSTYIARKGLEVVGVDISIEHLKKASPVFERVQSDACNLPFRSGSFDSALCFELLEHLSSPESCISEVRRVLKGTGTALFVCPCLNIPCKALIPIYRKLAGVNSEAANEHLHVFSTQCLEEMLSHHFEIIALKYVRFLTILENRLGIGRSFEPILSAAVSKIPLLRYFAACVWIKVLKREQNLVQRKL